MNGLELPTTSGRRRRIPRRGVLAAVTGLVAMAIALLMIGGVGASVNGAAFTTDNPAVTGPCLNGPSGDLTPSVNCNIYQAKKDVWINGGPSNGHNHLTDGDYFFAVLEPGGQPDPNDGGAKNLSDTGLSGGTNDTCGDAYANRTFTVSDGHVSAYTGDGSDNYGGAAGDPANPDPCTGGGTADPHVLDTANGGDLGNLIQLWPYDTTGNPGGVYILAICSLAGGYPVDPHDCKYDAFKVRPAGCTTDCGPPPAADLFGSKSAVPDYTREYNWTIGKGVDACAVVNGAGRCDINDSTKVLNYTVTVTKDTGTDSGWTVSGDIGVTNPATGAASEVKVTDATDAGGDCVVSTDLNLGLDPTAGGTLPGDGGTADYPYTCTFSSKPSGKHTNTATVSWNPNLSDGSVTPSTSFPATADFTFGDPTNVIHDSVNITDLYTFNPTTGATCSGIPTGSLSDSHTYNYTCTVSVPSGCVTLDNTATFTVTDADGDAADDTGNSSVTAKVCRIAADLSGSKNATPAYTREYNWSIRKGVDACAVVNNVGGCNITGPTKVLNYTVTVTKNTGTESGWKVSGDIGVTNPDAADVSGVKVTDATNAGAGSSCVVSTDLNHGLNPAAGGTLLAGYTADYPYTCTFSSKPIGTKTNTATVTWNPTLSDGTITANSSFPATADFTFGDPTTVIHNSVNITDVYTFSPTSGATCSGIPSGSINSSTTYQYTCTVSVPRACVTLNNTATFTVTTADSDTDDTGNSSVAAKVCRIPASTGALTMGFWQNSNGQGLIKTYCNGTALRTFLLSFAPFQDLSASASCTDIASYVSTKIGLANCGGATCNAMLKAQDLATTLDVFFTGPGWTGSKIGSVKPPSTFLPNSPLGNVQIDLTQICNMTDGSGGSGTCSGSFATASTVFGGAPCLYVYNTGQLTDILRYAASQSDVGGTLWYANNKANQVLAKNVFDAINNQAAFSCT